MTRSEEIEKVELTPEELSIVIWQAKYVKWNKERFRDYWEELEKQKPGKDDLRVRKPKDWKERQMRKL